MKIYISLMYTCFKNWIIFIKVRQFGKIYDFEKNHLSIILDLTRTYLSVIISLKRWYSKQKWRKTEVTNEKCVQTIWRNSFLKLLTWFWRVTSSIIREWFVIYYYPRAMLMLAAAFIVTSSVKICQIYEKMFVLVILLSWNCLSI